MWAVAYSWAWDAHAGKGGSITELSVTDNYRDWAVMVHRAHRMLRIASQFAALLRLVFQPGDKALTAPKLDCAIVGEATGFADRFVVVNAIQRLVSIEVTIGPNSICSVGCHVLIPQAGAIAVSLSAQ
jgi:hypothetical protein